MQQRKRTLTDPEDKAAAAKMDAMAAKMDESLDAMANQASAMASKAMTKIATYDYNAAADKINAHVRGHLARMPSFRGKKKKKDDE